MKMVKFDLVNSSLFILIISLIVGLIFVVDSVYDSYIHEFEVIKDGKVIDVCESERPFIQTEYFGCESGNKYVLDNQLQFKKVRKWKK